MQRLEANPLIRPVDVVPSRDDFEVVGTFNAGATRLGNETVLLVRVAEKPKHRQPDCVIVPIWDAQRGDIELLRVRRDDPELEVADDRVFHYRGNFHLTSISHLRVARATDGVSFSVEEAPALLPQTPTETFGLEDPRITRIDDDYWITYKAVSHHGITTALAQTRDFKTFLRHGVIFCPENLDVVLFPQKIGGHYAAWTRPAGRHIGPPAIWAARSNDLLNWGGHEPVLAPRPGYWDSARVGASCVPILTEDGWLIIYHGADASHLYCAGAVLVAAEDPTHILARSDQPLLWPEAKYEKAGFFPNVVFPTGAALQDDQSVLVYYGAADETTCAARTSVAELLEHLGV